MCPVRQNCDWSKTDRQTDTQTYIQTDTHRHTETQCSRETLRHSNLDVTKNNLASHDKVFVSRYGTGGGSSFMFTECSAHLRVITTDTSHTLS